MTSPVSVYRIFRRGDGEAGAGRESMRSVVVAMVIVAATLTATGLYRVSREHAVLRDGYELSAKSELVRRLRETRRRLELEHAVLAAPERIHKLAMQLGMTQVAPDRIRVVVPGKVAER
jgi:cell division protein FtsL